MIACRPLPRLLTTLIVLSLLTWNGASALAQDGQAGTPSNISSDLISAQSLTDEQQQTIAQYVARWSEQLHTGSATEITQARQRLVEPLNSPTEPSLAFANYFNAQLLPNLEEALASERLITRLNTMIVATYMTSGQMLSLIEAGLDDDNPGVRYWAAKAVQHAGARDVWAATQQVTVLQDLADRLGQEETGWVVQQLMLAIVELELPEAADQVLTALNRRVESHFQSPGRSIEAEQAGLERLFRELIGAEQPSDQVLRELARTGYRYMRLAGTHLQRGNISENEQPGYAKVMEVADTIMRTVHDQLNGNQSLPSAPDRAVRQEAWDQVLVIADRWQQVLQNPPFNFSEDDLALTSAAAQSTDDADSAENTEGETDANPAEPQADNAE